MGLVKLAITFAGTPAAALFSGMSDTTTDPAAIALFRPIVTPFRMMTEVPTKTFSSK
jgi:hypothetical protein